MYLKLMEQRPKCRKSKIRLKPYIFWAKDKSKWDCK